MIKYIFKSMWNQKRKSAFIIFKMFLLFIAIFLCIEFIYEKTEPLLYENGYTVNEDILYLQLEHKPDSANEFYKAYELKQRLMNLPNIENISVNHSSTPYIGWNSAGTVKSEDKLSDARFCYVDKEYFEILNINFLHGEVFSKNDTSGYKQGIIITKKLTEKLYNSSPIGKELKLLSDTTKTFKVMGIVNPIKKHDYEIPDEAVFTSYTSSTLNKNLRNTTFYLIKKKKNSKLGLPEIYEEIFKFLDDKKWTINDIGKLSDRKFRAIKKAKSEVRLYILLAIFLIINLFLGLIGIFGYNIKRRISEIGIKRAIGSTKSQINKHLVIEMIFLTLLGIIPAIIILIQLPILDLIEMKTHIFIYTLISTIIVIILIVSGSVIQPSIKASRIQPALALKKE